MATEVWSAEEFARHTHDFADLGLFCSEPFQVGWYNKERRERSFPDLIDAPDGAPAVLVASNGRYLDTIISRFSTHPADNDNFVDATTDFILAQTLPRFPPGWRATGFNVDTPPYRHVQTMAHVVGGSFSYLDQKAAPVFEAGELTSLRAELLEVRNANEKMWGKDNDSVFPVVMNERYGGWFIFRFVLIFPGLAVDLVRQPPKDFLTPEQKKHILTEFNLRGNLSRWRDLEHVSPADKYPPAAYLYFHETDSKKRRRFLELASASR